MIFRLRQGGLGFLPDGRCGGFVQQFIDTEVALQLEVGPVVERIAQGVGDRAREGEKFFVGLGVAGDQALVGTVGAHRPPFVVISLQPDFEKIFKATIVGNVLRRQVIVVVEDRLWLGVFVVQPERGVGLQQEIVVDERLGHRRLFRTI